MAITTQFLTGFEHGFVGIAAFAGLGLFDNVTAGFSASTSSPRNGSYCAHGVFPATTNNQIRKLTVGPPTKCVSRVAVKVTARPTSGTCTLFYLSNASAITMSAISVSSAGVLSAQFGTGTVQTGPTIDTTNWHLIEVQVDAVAGTLDWKVDGVLQTRATGTTTPQNVNQLTLGTASTNPSAYTVDYDDWIFGTWTAAATDWYGDGKVLAQLPGSDGTHATVASLSPGDAGTAYSGTVTTAWTMVDDAPGAGGWSATRDATDNLALRVATAAAYLEIKPAPTAEVVLANAVRGILSYSSSTTTANLAACDVRNSAGVVTELWGLTGGVGKAYNVTANNFKGGIVTAPAAGWTAAEVNAVLFRFGGCTSADISPVPTAQAMMLEVDWSFATPPPVIPVKPRVMRQAVNRAAVM